MGRFIFFDIDGTLAHPGQAPSESTVKSIQTARRNGHKVFISTGRTMDSIPTPIATIGFDGGIFSSGGIIAVDNTIVVQHFMDNAVVQKILAVLHRHNMLYTLETPEGRFNSENAEDLLERIDFSGIGEEQITLTRNILLDPTARALSHYYGESIHKISYYSDEQSITPLLASELQSTAKVVPFPDIPGVPLAMGEISDYAVNKGRALKDLCNYFGCQPSDCIAFGDSMNDSEILTAAGLGIAMGNADEQLKAIAGKVCDRCENDGIAKALQELGLI